MATNQQTARRRRQDIDPKLLRKHSDVVQRRSVSLVTTGHRERTETGFRIPGFTGKGLETFVETFVSGTASPLMCHAKKDRVVRVLSGAGFVVLASDTGAPHTEKSVHPGDEIVLRANTNYGFSTASSQALELAIAQEPGYEKQLKIIQKSAAVREISDAQLIPAVRDLTTLGMSHRRGSKAKEQLQSTHSARMQSGQVMPDAPLNPAAVLPMNNAKPSMGRFAEEGAG